MFFSGEEIALKATLHIALFIPIQYCLQLIFLTPNMQEPHNDYESHRCFFFFSTVTKVIEAVKLMINDAKKAHPLVKNQHRNKSTHQ